MLLPSPVSPQPPLAVLPLPVVLQSIGSQPSSNRACALLGLWRHHSPPTHSYPLSLPAFCPSSLCSYLLPVLVYPWFSWMDKEGILLLEWPAPSLLSWERHDGMAMIKNFSMKKRKCPYAHLYIYIYINIHFVLYIHVCAENKITQKWLSYIVLH